MRALARPLLIRLGLYRLDRRIKQRLGIAKSEMTFPPYGADTQRAIRAAIDVVRYGAVALAVHRLERTGVPGAFAEVGVYRGELSRFVATMAPQRTLHLFDTFAGFAPQDAESATEAEKDTRFRDTSVAQVRRHLGAYAGNAVFHAGYFPETAATLADERFAFVMLDVDKYKPTLAGLEVFYPRLSRGGYLFVHDYSSPESNAGVSRAVDAFFDDKAEQLIELPDRGGSVMVRKV